MSLHTPCLSMYRGFILYDCGVDGTYARLADENRQPLSGDDAVELWCDLDSDITGYIDDWCNERDAEAEYQALATEARRKANNALIYATSASATQSLLADASFHALANGEAPAAAKVA